MASGTRVVLNRAALDEVRGGLADGVFDLASAVLEAAERRAPDRSPIGEGLVAHGAAAVWTDGKQTHETAAIEKPRELGALPDEIVGVVGFTFPGRFQETGTEHHGPQPFLTPAAADVLGSGAEIILSTAMARRLGRGRP